MKKIIVAFILALIASSTAFTSQYFNDKGINDGNLIQPYDSAPSQNLSTQQKKQKVHKNQVLQNRLTPLQTKQLGKLCGSVPICECIHSNQQAKSYLGFDYASIAKLCQH
ncbi:MAG: hypothetical protein P1U40_02160 [Coxiellaceae bacterium]|nr:hypothetical protein [Coxiellaceae bacterium]